MAKWRETIDVTDVFRDYPDEISLAMACRRISERSKGIIPASLLRPLEALAQDEDGDDTKTFDAAWSRIYDWADQHRVWIATQ